MVLLEVTRILIGGGGHDGIGGVSGGDISDASIGDGCDNDGL